MSKSGSELQNKVVIVTGAAQGIGRAIALTLARAGADVVVNDSGHREKAQHVAEKVESLGRRALVVTADVSQKDEVERMVNTTLATFRKIDILVNNAGVIRPSRVENIDDAEWDLVVGVNLKGVFNCSKAVLKTMKERKMGKIVNISSAAGRSTSTVGGAHYTASKAGVLGLTRHLALECAPYGINVNAVAPGEIDTEMMRTFTTSEELKEIASKIPMRRLGTSEDVANVVLFLVSDASSYVTGATIDVNGGSLLI